jgi:hypothetical protein
MDASQVKVSQLQRRVPSAWSALLQQHQAIEGLRVLDVTVEQPIRWSGCTRYLLTLEGHSDAIPLLGKRTNELEARFYQELAQYLPAMTASCWLSHVDGARSWIVLDDLPDHWPAERWTADDIEKVVASLVAVHATFWEMGIVPNWPDWLPAHHSLPAPRPARRGYYEMMREGSSHLGLGRAAVVSAHALQVAGRLAPAFVRCAAGLETLRALGGWPGIIEESHLNAVADLLDDPLPMLQPLRELPVTLLHGNPIPRHWRSTLFSERYLIDWQENSFGPSVCDLVSFLEAIQLLWTEQESRSLPYPAPTTVQTIIDSYMVRMSMLLGRDFSARAARQAIPGALCLHVLLDWLPRFAQLFEPYLGSPHSWQMVTQMNDQQLERVGLGAIAGKGRYLQGLFRRFRAAFNAL